MKANRILYLLPVLFGILIYSCQKEYSFEVVKDTSSGSLQSAATGECLGITATGVYTAGSLLADTNTVSVQVDVTVPGTYTIVSDTVNGYYFSATGTFVNTGLNTVVLKGQGTPVVDGIDAFTVSYDSTNCLFAIQVQTGTGNGGSATVTLDGAPDQCASAQVYGTYIEGTPLDAGDSVSIAVNVGTTGSFSITTVNVNGIAFSVTGSFTATGSQRITMTGTGVPLEGGDFDVPITVGSSTCSFRVTVTPTPSSTEYFPRTANSFWLYNVDNSQTDTLKMFVDPTMPAFVAAGQTFTTFTLTDGAVADTTEKYRRTSTGNYYYYTDFGYILNFDNSLYAETLMLKDNAPAGTTWTSPAFAGTQSGSPYVIRIRYVIAQKDATINVNGVDYPNVIVVNESLELLNGSTWQNIASQTGSLVNYYARDIGRIQSEQLDGSGASTGSLKMYNYQIF